MNKLIVLCSFMIGTIYGGSLYLNEEPIVEQEGVLIVNSSPDEKVLKQSPDLDQILNLKIPEAGEGIAAWEDFMLELETLDLGYRNRWTEPGPYWLFILISRNISLKYFIKKCQFLRHKKA